MFGAIILILGEELEMTPALLLRVLSKFQWSVFFIKE
jgi:hypothetical protein